MASCTPQGASLLFGWRRGGRFTKGIGEKLPIAYQKFWNEWKVQVPTPVHYIPENAGEKFKRNSVTGEVSQNQIVPLPLLSIPEEHSGDYSD